MRESSNSWLKHMRVLNLRFNRLKRIIALIVIIQFGCFFYFFHNNYASLDNKTLFASSTLTRFHPNQIEFDSSDTPPLIQRYLSLQPSLLSDSLYSNCVNYFDTLNNTDFFKSLSDLHFHHEPYTSNFHDEVLKYLRLLFEKNGKDKNSVNEENDVKPTMTQFTYENKKFEDQLRNLMARMRIYGKCFLDNRVKYDISPYEHKMFPYVSGQLPIFENAQGKVLTKFPKLAKYKVPPYSRSFLQTVQGSYNGRGIVMSIGDKFVDETIQLIRVLRFVNNTLPIELVHHNELTELSKKKLFNVSISTDLEGPKQNLYLVNIAGCLTNEYKDRFKGFNSKWMAVLFSSFEEMVLMDNDLVPFINPMKFFQDYEGYNNTGTYFFRDRESFERTNKATQALINKVLPSKIEHLLFDVPHYTKEKLAKSLHFFDYGAKHFMESGIVVMNKSKNFKGLLTSINTQLTSQLVEQFYGDKEIFWLGQILAGNENLYFNKHAAGNIGKLEEVSKYSKSIKGIQPAHLSPLDDHSLLWVNSGLKNCKKNTAAVDFEEVYLPKHDTRFKTISDVEKYYNSAIDIEAVIVPPNSNKDWNNLIHEPSRGFHQMDNQGCGGYYWFAYSSVGTPQDPPELTNGLVVEFSDLEKDFFKRVEKIWLD